MNILFINLPFSGHVFPTLGLVKELISRNHNVTYLLTSEWEEHILKTGAVFVGYKNDKKLSVQMRNAYNVAVDIVQKFDLVIYEQFFFLGKHISEQFQKPVVRIFTSPAINKALMKAYLSEGGMISIFRSKWVCRHWTKDVTSGIKLKTDCWIDEILQNPPELNLVYTNRVFQPYADDFPEEHYKFLGASIYERNQDTDLPLERIKKPLIYISLGSILSSKAFYKKCFLAFKDENITVIMTIGNKVKMSSLGDIPENFLIYSFVPQLDVLKRADVFITHGGMNSVMEALYFGVPMVVIPYMADQPMNVNRIEELNLGKRLEHKEITSKSLKDTTLNILKDKDIQQNILSMQSKIQEINGSEYGADLIIEYMK